MGWVTVQILTGDVRTMLRQIPAGTFHTVVTSPPYFGLRSYLPDDHPDKHLEIGLETTLEEYIAEMVLVFREVRRVLRNDGTVWLNIGDSYAGSWSQQAERVTPGQERFSDKITNRPKKSLKTATARAAGVKPKDLFGVPWRMAFALQAAGWYWRSAIVWHKPNPMPESAVDRPTSAWEPVLLLSRSDRYFYDLEAVREDATRPDWVEENAVFGGPNKSGANIKSPQRTGRRPLGEIGAKGNAKTFRGGGAYTQNQAFENSADVVRDSHGNAPNTSGGRNLRNVWTIAPTPFPDAHFATFPPELAARCIKAGSSEGGCCAMCGAPFVRIVEKGEPDLSHQRACGGDASGAYTGQATKDFAASGAQDASAVKARILQGMRTRSTTGWRRPCKCPDAPAVPCRVLDPFGGAGTVGLVADRLQRDSVLIDLHPDYAVMAERRIAKDAGMFATVGTGEAAA